MDPARPAVEIDLPDHNGQLFKLSDMHGKVVLLFFGFTNCVDECPLTMAHLKLALEQIADDAQKVQVVLVSTDPVRDTPHALAEFLSHFNPGFLGIPGTSEQLTKLWDSYGIEVMDGGETHSSFTYVIDKAGNLRLKISSESAPDEIASDLRILLAEQ
jgi:protein SCO1/2